MYFVSGHLNCVSGSSVDSDGAISYPVPEAQEHEGRSLTQSFASGPMPNPRASSLQSLICNNLLHSPDPRSMIGAPFSPGKRGFKTPGKPGSFLHTCSDRNEKAVRIPPAWRLLVTLVQFWGDTNSNTKAVAEHFDTAETGQASPF